MKILKYQQVGNKILGLLEVDNDNRIILFDTAHPTDIETLGHYSEIYWDEVIHELEEAVLQEKIARGEEDIY